MKEKKHLLLPFSFVLLNFIVKGIFLGSNSLAGDEPYSVYYAQLSPSGIIHQLYSGNNPPLYELFLHFWIKICGISEFAVRFPSLVFSSVAVWFIFRIGHRFINYRVAIYASIIYIFSNYHILLAHESRAYALLGMLCAMSMYYYFNHLTNKSRTTWNLVFLILTNVLLIYTHYFGFIVLFLQFGYLLFSPKLLKENLRFLIINIACILLTALPFLSILIDRLTISSKGTWVQPPGGIDEFFHFFRLFSNSPVGAAVTLILLLVGMVFVFFIRKNEKQRTVRNVVFIWSMLTIVLMFAISFSIPMFLDRYLMVGAIGLTLAIAISADVIVSNGKWKYVVPVTICLLFMAASKPNKGNKREVRQVVERIKSLRTDKNTLVVVTPYIYSLNVAYYYDQNIFRKHNDKEIFEPSIEGLKAENIWCLNGLKDFDASKWKKVVFVDAGGQRFLPENNCYKTLEQQYMVTHSEHIEEIFDICVFETK